jgi:hypothetical protein
MRNSKCRGLGLLLIVALVAAFTAVPAYAQTIDDPSSAQYDPPIPDSGTAGSDTAGSGTAGSAATGGGDPGGLDSNIGSLPFTGLDLLIVVGVALVLTGTGFALRRLSTPRGPLT